VNELTVSRALYRGAVFLVCAVVLLLLLLQFKWVLLQVFAAAIIASAMWPIVEALTSSERARSWRWRPPRVLVVLVIYLTVGTLLLLVGAIVAGVAADQIADLIQRLPTLAHAAEIWLTDAVDRVPILAQIDLEAEIAAQYHNLLAGTLGLLGQGLRLATGVLSLFGGFLSALFILFMALYLTVDARGMRDYLLVFLPVRHQDGVSRIMSQIAIRLGSWVRGQLFLSAIIGAGAGIALSFLGVPYAALLALLWAIAECIPAIGPFVSTIPSILLGFTVSPGVGVMTSVFCLAYSQLESNVITPRVMGRAVKINPIVVLVALLVGNELLGVAGALMALPTAGALAVIVDAVRLERVRSQTVAEPDLPAPVPTPDGASTPMPMA
jgi:predicted PurR-regulated permease PerM